ncbi:MTH938/NDUFAF3 family protein [Desulfopila aestuarii]|uniref:Mth938-like domain-containing protein n=1 Tax=Desulfopila aestuarii DSM 18488 TaxID=1121416 RepID=A0A1M7Y257_9BACT|nr:MTH938/NDUFAF3 family protein [Desulfopila aestuarii]SHO45829.1 Protein of unknown function [Desulfopila aestuarii DSM 18488]
MENTQHSPLILTLGWGKMEVELLGRGKDFKLWPGGGRAWDWGESGTSHSRGIQVDDVKELVEHGAKVVVLTRGMLLRLKVPERAIAYLENRNIEVVVASTKTGMKIYNEYVEKNVPVAGLFHSTC